MNASKTTLDLRGCTQLYLRGALMRFKARRGTAKRFLLPVLVIGVFTALVVGAQAAPGDLDPGYGTGGLSTIDIVQAGNDDFATAMTMDEANRAVLVGYTMGADEDMAIARFKVDGTPDGSAFGLPGPIDSPSLSIDLGGNDRANSIAAIAGDKKAVLAGQTDVNGDSDFAVVRRNIPGGAADTTFNAAGPVPGQLLIDVCGNGGNDVANSVIRLADGKYLVGGYTDCNGDQDFAIARVTSKGVLDPKLTYTGSDPAISSPQPGVVLIDFGGDDVVTGLWAFSNTKWFASGYSDVNGTNDVAFAGFQGVNRVQPGFGGLGTGRNVFNLGGDDRNLAVAVDNNKKIIVAGSSAGNAFVARFKPNAKGLDLTFAGGTGIEVGDFGGTDAANAVVYQRRLDRKILPAGSTDASGNNNFGVERLLKDGARDSQFGSGGQVTTNFTGTSDDVATGIGFNTVNGKVVVSGYTNANGDYDFAVAGYLPT
jgi:uncharacterized delta-60 repeat protein